MPRFFVNSDQIDEEHIKILSDDAFHISRSLRMAKGEHITVCDGDGEEYDCILEDFLPDCVVSRIVSKETSKAEPPFFANVYQGLPKGDKLDTVIQKSVECGAKSITTFESEFCIVKVKAEAEDNKLERRNRIALEAAKQSGRALVPKVKKTLSFDEMLTEAKKCDFCFFCYEGEGTVPMGKLIKDKLLKFEKENGRKPDISIVVGPEGGFSGKEAAKAREMGFSMCGLGNRILRTETAAMFALCCLLCESELSMDS